MSAARLGKETSEQESRLSLISPHAYYVLRELPCPYLFGRQERKIVTDLRVPNATAVYSALSRGGFRRSHRFAYRPACIGCDACIPVRLATFAYAPSKSQRRVYRRNADLQVTIRPAEATPEQYDLFLRYLAHRHADGEMKQMDLGDFRAMVEETDVVTRVAEFRNQDAALVAGCIFDILDDGLSAVYSFFDPAQADRSLGTYTIQRLISESVQQHLPYLYLGYWIPETHKMSYKVRFKPLERLTKDGWQCLQQ